MTFKSNIIRVTIMAAVMIIAASSLSAQELTSRKHGSVREQMEQSALYNDSEYEQIRQLLDYAATFKGTRYRRGSSSPKGFDCSGFTSYVFKKFGYELNRSSSTQVKNGTPVAKNELQPGDLVFFNGRAVGKRIGHVGIVTDVNENGTFEFIHSSNTRGVVVSSSEEPYYKRRYVGANRVIESSKAE
ncbi:MAG: C40 family peptidase [Muribaculaceae bacterium]